MVVTLAAALVFVTGVFQVACGVLHCVERSAEVAAAPPCHGTDGDDASRSSHAPGGGDEECCQVLPLEPVSAMHAASIAPVAHVVASAPRVPSPAATDVPMHRVDTGPRVGRTSPSPLPLRI